MIDKPTIELRRFQHAAFASQETHCFSAEVWVNGEHAFDARNEGHGGSDHYFPAPRKGYREILNHDAMKKGMETLKAYCETLPPHEFGEGRSIPIDVEILIGNLVNDKLMERERRRLFNACKKRVLFLTQGPKNMEIRQTGVVPIEQHPRVIEQMRKKFPDAIFLNGMSEPEAFVALKKAKI